MMTVTIEQNRPYWAGESAARPLQPSSTGDFDFGMWLCVSQRRKRNPASRASNLCRPARPNPFRKNSARVRLNGEFPPRLGRMMGWLNIPQKVPAEGSNPSYSFFPLFSNSSSSTARSRRNPTPIAHHRQSRPSCYGLPASPRSSGNTPALEMTGGDTEPKTGISSDGARPPCGVSHLITSRR